MSSLSWISLGKLDEMGCNFDELAKVSCKFAELAKSRMSSVSWIS